MAEIKISGEGTISLSNVQALKLAEQKKTMPMSEQRETWLEIGSWQGYLSKVASITLEREYQNSDVDYNRPLTPEEKKHRDEMMVRARKNLEAKGLIRPNSNSPFASQNLLPPSRTLTPIKT